MIACPWLIFHSLGYLFKSDIKKGVVKTGVIYLSSNPSGATIYLNNKRFTQKTPAVIRDFLPGIYPIRLVLKGYQPWQEDVPVDAQKATVYERVLLLPQNFSYQTLLYDSFEDLMAIPETHFLILKKGSRLKDMAVYNWKTTDSIRLVDTNSRWADAVVMTQYMVAQSPQIFWEVSLDGETHVLLTEIKEDRTLLTDVSFLFPEKPSSIKWSAQNNDIVFSLDRGYLNKIDVSSKAIFPRLTESIKGFYVFGKSLYTFTPDYLISRFNYKGNGQELFLEEPDLMHGLFEEKGLSYILVYADDMIFFLGDKGALFCNRSPYGLVDQGITGLKWLSNANKVLFWSKDKIGIYDFAKILFQKNIGEIPSVNWIFKDGKRIEQAFWVWGTSHVLFRDGDTLYLIELETYGDPHINPLVDIKKNSHVHFVEESGLLYFLESASGHLVAANLVPRENGFPWPFPLEKKEKEEKEKTEDDDVKLWHSEERLFAYLKNFGGFE